MSDVLHPALMARLSHLLAEQTGLHFPRERWRDLERGMRTACKEFGFENTDDCLRWLTSSRLDKEQIEILAGHLTIGETYFFRDKKSFELLEQHLLPPLIEERRAMGKRLRIWSAACCTGEEAYSIAITLTRLIPDWREWRITVLATDINPRFLQVAARGVFREWAFRATPPEMKQQYFRQTAEGHYALEPQIRDMVKFEYLNLAEDVYPALHNDTNAMDIIFCRNVLIYFEEASARQVINQLHRCLVNGGWLLTSPSEALHVHFSEFETLHYPGAIVYRKNATETAPVRPSGFNYFGADATPVSMLPSPAGIPAPSVSSPTPFLSQEQPVTLSPTGRPAVAPPDYAAVLQRARELFELGRYSDCIALLEAPEHRNGMDGQWWALLARAYANSGQLDEALAAGAKTIAVDKMNPAFHYLYASILQEQGAIDEAVSALKRALYLDHDLVMAHFALGNLALMRHRKDEANRHFRVTLGLLDRLEPDFLLPESEGITVGRLAEIIGSITASEI